MLYIIIQPPFPTVPNGSGRNGVLEHSERTPEPVTVSLAGRTVDWKGLRYGTVPEVRNRHRYCVRPWVDGMDASCEVGMVGAYIWYGEGLYSVSRFWVTECKPPGA